MSTTSVAARAAILMPDSLAPAPRRPLAPPPARELAIDELEIRHLRQPDEIARVVHLRQEIHLPAAALADPDFASREKKETNTGSSADSCGAGPGLEPFVLFRSGSAWHPARNCW